MAVDHRNRLAGLLGLLGHRADERRGVGAAGDRFAGRGIDVEHATRTAPLGQVEGYLEGAPDDLRDPRLEVVGAGVGHLEARRAAVEASERVLAHRQHVAREGLVGGHREPPRQVEVRAVDAGSGHLGEDDVEVLPALLDLGRIGRVVVAQDLESDRRRDAQPVGVADVTQRDGEAVGLDQGGGRSQDQRTIGVGRSTAVHLGPVGNQLAGVQVDDDRGRVGRHREPDVTLGRQRGEGGIDPRDVHEDRGVGAESVVQVPRSGIQRLAADVGQQAVGEVDPTAGAGGLVLDGVGVAGERQEAAAGVERVAARGGLLEHRLQLGGLLVGQVDRFGGLADGGRGGRLLDGGVPLGDVAGERRLVVLGGARQREERHDTDQDGHTKSSVHGIPLSCALMTSVDPSRGRREQENTPCRTRRRPGRTAQRPQTGQGRVPRMRSSSSAR